MKITMIAKKVEVEQGSNSAIAVTLDINAAELIDVLNEATDAELKNILYGVRTTRIKQLLNLA